MTQSLTFHSSTQNSKNLACLRADVLTMCSRSIIYTSMIKTTPLTFLFLGSVFLKIDSQILLLFVTLQSIFFPFYLFSVGSKRLVF